MGSIARQELITTEPIGDIPWDMIQSHQILPGITWRAPQNPRAAIDYEIAMRKAGKTPRRSEINRLADLRTMRLEEVELINGLRYVVILDAKTGEKTFATTEYRYGTEDDDPCVSQPRAILAVDLGNGYKLSVLVGEKHSSIKGRKESWLESVVRKELSVNRNPDRPNPNQFRYRIDPYIRFFDGAYHFRSDREATSVYAATEDRTRTHFKGTMFSVCIVEIATSNQINFIFDPETGRLSEIQLEGFGLLGMEEAYEEVGWSDSSHQRGIVSITGPQLAEERSKLFVRHFLGVDYIGALTLDKRRTLDSLVVNADRKPHARKNPREVLVFKDAVKQPDWQLTPPSLPSGI